MESIDLLLTGLAYGGEAFGRDADNRMIFVPFALPDERVRVQIIDAHKRWARAQLIEVLKPSDDRINPRCRHFGTCGGCHYQHMPYEAQLQVKEAILREQLARIGGIENPPVMPTLPSPSPWNTRNHIRFSLDQDGRLGFKAAGSHDVVPIEECHLPLPEISGLWPRIEVDTDLGLSHVAVRVGVEGESMIVLQSDGEPEVDVLIDLPSSLVWLSPDGSTVLAGDDRLIFEVLGRTFQVSSRSFFQVNTALIDDLVHLVLAALSPAPGQLIFDLYAGVGLFSAFIAATGARVIAVEESPWACGNFEANLDEFEGVELYEAAVEITLPALGQVPDAVLVDPPRAGLSKEALRQLVKLQIPRLAYLSCDPATLARDAKQLVSSGYRLEISTPIDLFPQTYHIESLTVFSS
ncbi:MAG: TRAM domain-containing protein [Anaerolineales bacterium]|nr:TRAM domain-containing protein [Anaerolineales bacterium]